MNESHIKTTRKRKPSVRNGKNHIIEVNSPKKLKLSQEEIVSNQLFTLFLVIPHEILFQIASNLGNPIDLFALCMTCKNLYSIIFGEVMVWKRCVNTLGYTGYMTGRDMQNLSDSYLQLWVAENDLYHGTYLSTPIVGIVYGIDDPAKLKHLPLTEAIFDKFKNESETAMVKIKMRESRFPLSRRKFTCTISGNPAAIMENAKPIWAVGPLGLEFIHVDLLSYVISNCFILKIQKSGQMFACMDLEKCGKTLHAVRCFLEEYSGRKIRAFYIGELGQNNKEIQDLLTISVGSDRVTYIDTTINRMTTCVQPRNTLTFSPCSGLPLASPFQPPPAVTTTVVL